MKLVVHIGFHKTGTSAFQAYGRKNYKALIKAGLLYPEAGRSELAVKSTATSEAGHRRFDKILINPESRSATALLDAIVAEAGENGTQTIIVSSETFSAPRVKTSDHLHSVLRRYFDDVKVLAYVRKQDEWANSFYREYICWPNRRERRTYEQFCRTFLEEWLDYEGRLARWADVFGNGNVIVKSYDDRKEKNIIRDILGSLEIDSAGLPDMALEANPSLPASLIDFVREVNAHVSSSEQKVAITREMFRRLQESDASVEVPALRSEYLRSNRERFSESNRRIAARYRMDRSERFCQAVETTPGATMVEKSLSPEDLHALSTMLKGSEQRTLMVQPNGGSWGISCLSNERIAHSGAFIDYHLALGAARIIMFLDNPEDPIRNLVTDERVEFVVCTEAFWRRELGRMPDSNAEKLWHCHKLGLEWLTKRDNVDWAINIDADELIWVEPGRTMSDVLRHASKRANQVVLPPLEAIFVDQSDSELFAARYFKVLRNPCLELSYANCMKLAAKAANKVRGLAARIARYVPAVWRQPSEILARFGLLGRIKTTPLGLKPTLVRRRRWDAEDERHYREAMPVASAVLREGFLGHRAGRVATARGVSLDVVKSHRHYSTEHTIIRTNSRGIVCILHYDAVDYDAWNLKWHRRVFGGANVLNIAEERKKQQDMFLAAAQAGETRKLFKDLFFLPKEWLEPFLEQHLVVRITPPGIEEISEKWRVIEAEAKRGEAV